MSSVINELSEMLRYALNADPLYVLVPLAVIAVAEGLQAEGILEVFVRAMRGLVWLVLAVFVIGGLRSSYRFEFEYWSGKANAAFNEFMVLRVVDALGFYLLLLAGIALVFVVRQLVRR